MAQTFEGTLPSLLQGVSQQIPRERQDGQVGEQLNMLSDPVTGIRRRAGARVVSTITSLLPEDDHLFTAYIERGTDGRHLVINTTSGEWLLMSKDYSKVVNSGAAEYFQCEVGATSIQISTVAGLTYILNTEKAPNPITDNGSKKDPTTMGFVTLTTAALGKTWSVTVTGNGVSKSAYVIVASDASSSTARLGQVAADLVTGLKKADTTTGNPLADNQVVAVGNTIFFHNIGNCNVTSDAGTTYAKWSNSNRVDLATDLPVNLPPEADGMMMRVGTASSDGYTWYRFNYANRTWGEDGAYGSVTSITNMPLVLAADDKIIEETWEGRLAGDDTNNEDPAFVTNGYITGIASFQGRLCLLSGPSITMSASGLFQRFYRSTTTSLLDSDRIDISSASATNSVFRTAVQFNRDLVIFGDAMQAVIPGAAPVTPTSTSLTLTSEILCDSRVAPVVAGQTLLYPNRRSNLFAGIQEFIPSSYTASQYVSQDATLHIPKYIGGRVMKLVAGTTTNMVFGRYSGEPNNILVHEFMWGADSTKKQAAYHKWVMPAPVLSMHVSQEALHVYMRAPDSSIIVCAIDPREGFDNQTAYDLPYCDLYSKVTVSARTASVPPHLRYSSLTVDDLILTHDDGDNSGQWVGLESLDTKNWTVKVVRGVADGTYYLGKRYESAVTPTPPLLKDGNDKLVGSGHVKLYRYDVALKNSGTFDIAITDTSRYMSKDTEGVTTILDSKDLMPGYSQKSAQANVIIPCRTNADSTEVRFSTTKSLEMNILDISYILRYGQRRQRV